MDENKPKLDIINVLFTLVSIGLIASQGWPMVFILLPVWVIVHTVRNSPAMREWSKRIITPVVGDKIANLLPSSTIKEIPQLQEKQRTIVDPYEHLSIWDRVTKPIATTHMFDTVTKQKRNGVSDEDRQIAYLARSLKRLPSYIPYTSLPAPPSKLSVPLGYDPDTQSILWGDFDSESDAQRILHALIAGQTGSGKDALLRLWFTTLTINNTPEEIQFVILDGKIDWLSPSLAQSAYMALPPAGGIELVKENGKRIDKAAERMVESLDWVFEEIQRRSELMLKSGAVNLHAYNEKALKQSKRTLPMLFLIASDVGKTFNDDLCMLVRTLIMKGRAYGIRMIISMQNPVGEATDWRSQIGLVLSGYQQNPDHDRYIMGIPKVRALVRPSQLPNPEEYDEARGLFVVRIGSKQYLVRTPHLPEDDWFKYIDSPRFIKRWYSKEEQQALLEQHLFNTGITRRLEPIAPKLSNPQDLLTHAQIVAISKLAAKGMTKTEIMHTLGFTNGDTWNKKKFAVEQVIVSVRGSLR